MYLGEDLDKTNIYNYSSFNFVVENAYTIFDLRHMIDPKTFARKRIKKPYYLNSYKFVYENQTYTVYDHAPWSGLENISASWQKDGMILIRKRFHNFLKEDESLPKKIYIDRSDANSKWTKSKTFPQRIFKKEYIVKDYFKKHGFVPIVMSKYGYIDQLNFYFNATHIAGLCGTGLLGGFVAKNDTILIEVYTNKGYNFSYSYLTEISPIDVISIELRNGDGELNRDLYNILDKYKGAGFFGI
jgi:capsular polysaccharide biosynthesis protein